MDMEDLYSMYHYAKRIFWFLVPDPSVATPTEAIHKVNFPPGSCFTQENVKIFLMCLISGSLNKHSDKGTIYLKFFTFSQDLLPNVEHKLAALDELAQKL